jgi:Zinc-binding dehydrogenase
VFDTIGGEVLARLPAFIQESNRAQLIELTRLVDQGHLRPQVGAVYPLAQAAEAFSATAADGIPGRIVLQPWSISCPAQHRPTFATATAPRRPSGFLRLDAT